MDVRVVLGDGIGNLLQDGGLARARRGHNQPTGAFAEGCHHITDARFDQIRAGFQPVFFDWVNGRQVLEADGLGVVVKHHVIDFFDGLQLGAVAAVRRLGRPCHEAAFPQKIALDGVRRDENIRRFGMEMVLGGAEKTETFFGDFEIPGTGFRRGGAGRSCHSFAIVLPKDFFQGSPEITNMNFELFGGPCALLLLALSGQTFNAP